MQILRCRLLITQKAVSSPSSVSLIKNKCFVSINRPNTQTTPADLSSCSSNKGSLMRRKHPEGPLTSSNRPSEITSQPLSAGMRIQSWMWGSEVTDVPPNMDRSDCQCELTDALCLIDVDLLSWNARLNKSLLVVLRTNQMTTFLQAGYRWVWQRQNKIYNQHSDWFHISLIWGEEWGMGGICLPLPGRQRGSSALSGCSAARVQDVVKPSQWWACCQEKLFFPWARAPPAVGAGLGGGWGPGNQHRTMFLFQIVHELVFVKTPRTCLWNNPWFYVPSSSLIVSV